MSVLYYVEKKDGEPSKVHQVSNKKTPDNSEVIEQLNNHLEDSEAHANGISGSSTDVYLEEYGKTAKELGQIGNSSYIGPDIHLDTIKEPGNYICDATLGGDSGYPIITNTPTTLIVSTYNNTIVQFLSTRHQIWVRHYTSNSWQKFFPIGGCWNGNFSIYISKDGDDNNAGFDKNHPVATIDRALQIASSIVPAISNSTISLAFGPGSWGDISISNFPYRLHIRPFDMTTHIEYSDQLPVFGELYFHCCNSTITSIVADAIRATYNSCIVIAAGYKRIGSIRAHWNGKIYLGSNAETSNILDVYKQDKYTDAFIHLDHNGYIWADYITFNVAEDLTFSTSFIYMAAPSYLRVRQGRTLFTNSFNVTCKKLQINQNASIHTQESCTLMQNPTWFSEVPGSVEPQVQLGAIVNGFRYGEVSTYGSQEINGVKTFTNIPIIKFDTPRVFFSDPTVEKGTIPESDKFQHISFLDKKGNGTYSTTRLGVINYCNRANGRSELHLSALQNVANSSVSNSFWIGIEQNGTKYCSVHSKFQPYVDNTYSLGDTSLRWSQLYAGTPTINTSDEREKTSILNIPDEILDAWGEVNWQQYQFNDAVESKGSDKARLHTGIIAQRILEIFNKHNLDATKYGLLCYDSWEAEDWDETIIDKEAVIEQRKVVDKPIEYDSEGNILSLEEYHFEDVIIEPEESHIVHHHRDAGDRYGVRYEEALALEAAYQRRRADRLEELCKKLEERVSVIERRLG